MSLQEIESAISALPPGELAQFTHWFEQFQAEHDKQWDDQIAADMQAGRLDHLIARAKEQVTEKQKNVPSLLHGYFSSK